MRTPLIAGNWKMHNTAEDARGLARAVVSATATMIDRSDVLLAPPFTALAAVSEAVQGSAVRVGAQDMHWADQGAFTGAISPAMVAEFASHVIIGHSERRSLFGESDADVNRKVHAAISRGLSPIVCIGETLAQREAGQTDEIVTSQLAEGLVGIAPGEATALTVAYEPVWAIGTGLPCEADEAARVTRLIRSWLTEAFGAERAEVVRILYGGSVKPDNIDRYMAAPDIDGALVGGASLKADAFAALVRTAAELRA